MLTFTIDLDKKGNPTASKPNRGPCMECLAKKQFFINTDRQLKIMAYDKAWFRLFFSKTNLKVQVEEKGDVIFVTYDGVWMSADQKQPAFGRSIAGMGIARAFSSYLYGRHVIFIHSADNVHTEGQRWVEKKLEGGVFLLKMIPNLKALQKKSGKGRSSDTIVDGIVDGLGSVASVANSLVG